MERTDLRGFVSWVGQRSSMDPNNNDKCPNKNESEAKTVSVSSTKKGTFAQAKWKNVSQSCILVAAQLRETGGLITT